MEPPTSSAVVKLSEVKKTYDNFTLSVEDLEVREGEFFSVVGPSGAGKSTLLNLIGGFVQPDQGKVLLWNQATHLQSGRQRRVRTVFQDLALFPHLSVQRQLELAARTSGRSTEESKALAQDWLERLDLRQRSGSRPRKLSGGQKQRLAIGRALISSPRILLLDEPMKALDRTLRAAFWQQLDELAAGEGSITYIVVTHDPEVALSRSDRLLVLDKGECVQLDSPRTVYQKPKNEFVGRLLGPINSMIWNGERVLLRPEKITILLEPPSDGSVYKTAVMRAERFHGSTVEYLLESDEGEEVVVQAYTHESAYSQDAQVFLVRKPENVVEREQH